MFISLVISAILVIALFAITIKKKSVYGIATSGICAAIVMQLFVSLLYTAKFSFYSYTSMVDYNLYTFFLRITLGLSDIQTISNVSFALYMIFSLLFIVYEYRHKLIVVIITAVLVTFFLITTSPSTIMGAYINAYFSPEPEMYKKAENLFELAKDINQIILSGYIIATLFIMAKKIFYTKIFLKRYYYLAETINLIFCGAYIIFLAMSDYGNNVCFMNVDFAQTNIGITGVEIYESGVYIALILIAVVAAITIQSELHYSIWSVNQGQSKKDTGYIDDNLRTFLHTYKNSYFTIFSLAQQAQDRPKLADENINMIKNYAKEMLGKLDFNIKKLKGITIVNEKLSLYYIIERAVKRSKLKTENIELCLRDNTEYCQIYADENYLLDVFVNIFNNSAEAFQGITDREKKVEIIVDVEFDMAVVTVKDNGCGISKHTLKYLYEPMFSTKRSESNWGIGLTYIRKIIMAHKGSIYIKSKPDMYTIVQITLPIKTEEVSKCQK